MADNIRFSKHKEIKWIGYKKYDNYDAIEIPFTDAIPSDYDWIMWVPISFLSKYSPDQFEIIRQWSWNTRVCCPKDILKELGYKINKEDRGWCPVLNWKRTFSRIFIRHKK